MTTACRRCSNISDLHLLLLLVLLLLLRSRCLDGTLRRIRLDMEGFSWRLDQQMEQPHLVNLLLLLATCHKCCRLCQLARTSSQLCSQKAAQQLVHVHSCNLRFLNIQHAECLENAQHFDAFRGALLASMRNPTHCGRKSRNLCNTLQQVG